MKSDPSRPPDERPAETDDWLDGLAGRPGKGAAHDEGASLRAALQALDDGTVPVQPTRPWHTVVESAQQRLDSVTGPDGKDSSLLPARLQQRVGQRQPGVWRVLRMRADVALKVASAVLILPLVLGGLWKAFDERDDGVRLRGLAPGVVVSPVDVWRSERPEETARAMAARLEAAGAEVVLTPSIPGWELRVQADTESAMAVQAELMAIEVGLDAYRRATVKILPMADSQ